MTVTVCYFAAAREAAGTASERVRVADGATVGDLFATLSGRHPPLAGLPLRFAVGEEFVAGEARLAEGDTVALLPPVSGG